jgi:hypothetical protein
MSLFQSSVIAKHLQSQNKESIAIKWEAFKNHFHNPKVQEEIKSLKEEQYQGEFLEDFFVKILGYTKPASSSETKFNLTTEYKNIKDSKKADGAIIVNDVVKAVIELKGTNTTDLGKIEVQAFGYKNNQPECTYIITSNFEKLRFYIDNAIEHIEFNLFTLTEKEFTLLYLCLAYENIEKDIPKKIKEQSISQEDAVTKKLYNDYSLFKRELHQNLVLLNPKFDALELFKKSQKLLDRFLFLFFSEDRQLLPPNSVRLILDQWKTLQDLDEEIPLYNRFKKYFEYLNTGFKGKKYDVFAYNGGLFKPDEILDTIKIDDKLLFKHTKNLSEYDFDSEVDVNILGHIFENSLNELDEIKAQLAGETIDKNKSKRKKDGVFYTPKYITKYIVENTVGKLCEEKKNELQIIEDEYNADKKRQKKTIKALIYKLTEYRNWLLQLTICDPACGSGAFLNQALDFLINEHKYIDELQAKLFGDAMVLSDVEKSILENNLFGVDLNEESVEIAKLSLWLRTAQPNRKLNDLNNNIKCGNSLIDDVAVAGDKAFNWQQEFPQIFAQGGFDVVIGNPPYVNVENLDDNVKQFLFNNYSSAQGRTDLYVLFVEKSISIIKEKGLVGLIIPYSFTNQNYAQKIRENIVKNHYLISIVDTSNYFVFSDAIVKTIILLIGKRKINNDTKIFRSLVYSNLEELHHEISQHEFLKLNKCIFETKPFINLIELKNKIEFNTKNLEKICLVAYGVRVNSKTDKSRPKSFYVSSENKGNYKKFIEGKDVERYYHKQTGWLNYLPNEHYNSMFPELFENEKLFFINVVSDRIRFSYDNENLYNSHTVVNCIKIEKLIQASHISARRIVENSDIMESEKYNLKFILSILNSNLINWYFLNFLSEGLHFYPDDAKNLPIKFTINQQPFIEKADLMLSLNLDLQETSQKFQRILQRKFELETLPKKLQDWYLLSFAEFIKELGKKKVKLSLSQEAEWEDYFLLESKKALELKTNIDTTDKEIDQMVYELYGLTEEEIKIVENY